MKIKFKSILILLNRNMEINGYPNYLIYNDGRVYSKKSKKFMKNDVGKVGYCRVPLYCNKKCKKFLVHRLVALHYIPNPNNYPEVDHIDIDTSHNYVSNLRWVTRKMNMDNRKKLTNTGEKYITINKPKNRNYKRFHIKVDGNSVYLNCRTHTLQDAINVRDSLLG